MKHTSREEAARRAEELLLCRPCELVGGPLCGICLLLRPEAEVLRMQVAPAVEVVAEGAAAPAGAEVHIYFREGDYAPGEAALVKYLHETIQHNQRRKNP